MPFEENYIIEFRDENGARYYETFESRESFYRWLCEVQEDLDEVEIMNVFFNGFPIFTALDYVMSFEDLIGYLA